MKPCKWLRTADEKCLRNIPVNEEQVDCKYKGTSEQLFRGSQDLRLCFYYEEVSV